MRFKGTWLWVAAGATVGVVAVVGYSCRQSTQPGTRALAGSDTFDTMRLAAFKLWRELKRRDYQPPNGWADVPGISHVDEWGNAFEVVIKRDAMKNVPESLLEGRELPGSPEQLGWIIALVSKGPDGKIKTDDDLVYWRINSVTDGNVVAHGFVYAENIWPALDAER